MNLKNQPPVFVPREFQAEIEKLSKAALMDAVWDLATRCAGTGPECEGPEPQDVMDEVRRTASIILSHRSQARI